MLTHWRNDGGHLVQEQLSVPPEDLSKSCGQQGYLDFFVLRIATMMDGITYSLTVVKFSLFKIQVSVLCGILNMMATCAPSRVSAVTLPNKK